MINKVYNEVDNLVVEAVTNFVHSSNSASWTGTMTGLSSLLGSSLSRKDRKHLPGSPSALRKVIDRNIGRIRNRKVSIKFTRSVDRNRTRLVTLATK